MSTPTSRARHRDNAARLGKFQTRANRWLDTAAGQLTLLGIVAVALLVGFTIGR
jgi:hypothetical protein